MVIIRVHDHDHEITNLTRHRVGLAMVAVCRTALQFANHFPAVCVASQRPMLPGSRRGHRPVSEDVLQAARSRQVFLQASLRGVYRSARHDRVLPVVRLCLYSVPMDVNTGLQISQSRPAARLCGRPIHRSGATRGCWSTIFLLKRQDHCAGRRAGNEAAFTEHRSRAASGAGSRPDVTGSRLGVVAAGPRHPTRPRRRSELLGPEDPRPAHDDDVWLGHVLFVRVCGRRIGVTPALLTGAVELAEARDVKAVEGSRSRQDQNVGPTGSLALSRYSPAAASPRSPGTPSAGW